MLVIDSSEIKNIEKLAAQQGMPLSSLMEQAGTKIAEIATEIIYKKKLKNICIICGTGNNGGDGLVAARLMSVMKCNVRVILADGDPKTDLAKMNFNLLPNKVEVFSFYERAIECVSIIEESDMIIDAVYGIGFRDGLNPQTGEIIRLCNENKKACKIAVDVPSGIVCDSGEIINDCFKADITVSFTALKPLHVLYPSMDCCGEIRVADVGIPKNIMSVCSYTMKTTDCYIKNNPLRERRMSAHKGSNGTLLSICGSYGMAGAAILSGGAALRTGVGLLKSAVPKSIYPIVASQLPESVFMPLDETENGTVSVSAFDRILSEIINKAGAVLIGCGLGQSDDITQLVSMLVENSTKPLVIDADGINALSMNIDILRRATVPIILTPHPGEMARLTSTDIMAVQLHRYEMTKLLAQEYHVTVVLKGANTIIATPEGKVYVNRTGNNGMAKGGSGDVLAGIMASLLAQGTDAEKAAVYAVYYHGLAGDRCAENYTRRSMLPSDLVDEIRYSEFGKIRN